jgi:hypothetical protein
MKKTLLAMTVSVLASNAIAQTEYFAGISLGRSQFPNQAQSVANDVVAGLNDAIINAGADESTTTATVTQKRNDTGYKIFGGAWLNDNYGYEIGYVDLGKTKFTVDTDTAFDVNSNGPFDTNTRTTADVSSKAFYAAFLAGQKFSNKSRLYAKVGLYRASTKLKGSGVATSDDLPDTSAPFNFSYKQNNTNVLLGVGYLYPITDKIDIKAEAEQFRKVGGDDVGKGNINLISLGLSYKF